MFYKAEMATMLPVMKYKKFPYTVIRPMALVKEKEIIKFATEKGFHNLVCKCPYSKNSKRLEVRQMIKELSKNNRGLRDNIYKAMKNVNLEYLLASH
jgi:tRNA(Ile)-lysidine synthase TilS/MesJ